MKKTTDWIQTYTGKKFYPLEPDASLIDIRDIAHALSLKVRYNGHCDKFYSVAQHSVLMCDYISNTIYQMWALLHDAGEAYLADIPRPIKRFTYLNVNGKILTFTEVENVLRIEIFKTLAPFIISPEKEPDYIKRIDTRILINEASVLMKGVQNQSTWESTLGVSPLTMDKIKPWSAEKSEIEFLNRYNLVLSKYFNE